jgi:hypothetical protein
MPWGAIAPVVGALGSSLLGGLFGSGKSKQQQNQTTTSHTTGEQTSDQTAQGYTQQTEPDYMSQFRQMLLPQFGQLMQRAQQPVFGNPQIAQFMQQSNQAGEGAINSLSQNLARRGVLDSGAFASGIGDIQRGNVANQTGFLSQLPFLNNQAYMSNVGGLLGQGMNFAGRGPIGQFNFGNTTGRQTMSEDKTTTGNAQQTQQGAPWWQQMMDPLSKFIGAGAAGRGPLQDIFDPFRS